MCSRKGLLDDARPATTGGKPEGCRVAAWRAFKDNAQALRRGNPLKGVWPRHVGHCIKLPPHLGTFVNQPHISGGCAHRFRILVRYPSLLDNPTFFETDIVVTKAIHLLRIMGNE